MNTVIEPKYVYAMNFWNGRAVVCKGEWTTVEKKGKLQYWCEKEGWDVIDQHDREIVPCRFDELYELKALIGCTSYTKVAGIMVIMPFLMCRSRKLF